MEPAFRVGGGGEFCGWICAAILASNSRGGKIGHDMKLIGYGLRLNRFMSYSG